MLNKLQKLTYLTKHPINITKYTTINNNILLYSFATG